MLRLIPAGAGSTANQCTKTLTATAHPRWRGEHFPEDYQQILKWGSSPLARGAPGGEVAYLMPLRLIPAGAGSTESNDPEPKITTAHPRWRGEHRSMSPCTKSFPGSSPLARGAQTLPRTPKCRRGLIPAGAGSTSSRLKTVSGGSAHPRWRGEHTRKSCGVRISRGSSPLARGARMASGIKQGVQRLIPAGAGSTRLPLTI